MHGATIVGDYLLVYAGFPRADTFNQRSICYSPSIYVYHLWCNRWFELAQVFRSAGAASRNAATCSAHSSLTTPSRLPRVVAAGSRPARPVWPRRVCARRPGLFNRRLVWRARGGLYGPAARPVRVVHERGPLHREQPVRLVGHRRLRRGAVGVAVELPQRGHDARHQRPARRGHRAVQRLRHDADPTRVRPQRGHAQLPVVRGQRDVHHDGRGPYGRRPRVCAVPAVRVVLRQRADRAVAVQPVHGHGRLPLVRRPAGVRR